MKYRQFFFRALLPLFCSGLFASVLYGVAGKDAPEPSAALIGTKASEDGPDDSLAYFQAEALISCAPEYRDYKRAAALFESAAAKGDPNARCALAKLYLYGLGVNKDVPKALKLFSESAEGGCSAALYNMGVMFETSVGVQRNISKAIDYYRRAAALGNSQAKEALELLGENSEEKFSDKYIFPIIVIVVSVYVISRLLGTFIRLRKRR